MLYKRKIGTALLPVSNVYKQIMVPFEMTVEIDLKTVVRASEGRIRSCSAFVFAEFSLRDLDPDFDWESMVGDRFLQDSFERVLRNFGHQGRVTWASLRHQKAGRFRLVVPAERVEEMFPEAFGLPQTASSFLPQPERVEKPELRFVV